MDETQDDLASHLARVTIDLCAARATIKRLEAQVAAERSLRTASQAELEVLHSLAERRKSLLMGALASEVGSDYGLEAAKSIFSF